MEQNPGELSRAMECTLTDRPRVRRTAIAAGIDSTITAIEATGESSTDVVTHQLTAGSGQCRTAQLHAHLTRVSRHGRTHRQTLRRRRAHTRMSSHAFQ